MTDTGAGTPRLYQCPGCWSWGMWPGTDGSLECDCGERLTLVDLRESRPATDPAGLDGLISPGTVEDVAVAMHDARITGCAFSGVKQMCSPRDHMEDARVYLRARRARLAVADGPGPEERPDLRAELNSTRGALVTVAQWDSWASDWLAKHPALPVHREETGRS